MSHFKLISSTRASDVIPVNKYVSEKTGISVIIAGVEGPLVNGFFCLATEAHDDDGLPHTLEHLIFLGSKRYPYKGVLDLLANRCMAHGTNAWTDVDHTCYTINTAGDEGMLILLPIYLDHILHPTLTDEGFITEVHHIDGEGEDAGVVYCEMQGRENNAVSRCELRMLRAMYPNSGYSSETGGIMANLRTSTNNTKVRDFHKHFYRAENLTIILTGQIDPNDVFNALASVEDDIIAKRSQEPQAEWVKPWQNMPPPPVYGEYKVQWPADTEDCGQVWFGWRGPVLNTLHSQREMTACAVLVRYLCETASAPLQRCLVEREDALAGDVSYTLTENMASLIKIQLDNVPIAKLEAARDQALQCLRRVRSGEEPLDAQRLQRLVRKHLRETIATLEADPHHAVAFRCIGDALYSNNKNDFVARMNPQLALHELMTKDTSYWLSTLQRYFTDDMVSIIGSPLIELMHSMAQDEKNRIEAQKTELGESGLAEKAGKLNAAIDFNERPPPPGTLAAVPVPSCDRLKSHRLHSWRSDATDEPCPHFQLSDVPMYTRVHTLKTSLVYISLMLDTSSAAVETRKWLPLLMNALGECPVRRGDRLISHEEIITTIEHLTIMFTGEIGFGRSGNFTVGQFGNFVHIETRCEPADYEDVVNLVYEVLYKSEITKERLLVFAQRLLNDVAQVRRNGHKMVYDILRDSVYSKESNMHWCTVLRQQKFLKQLIEQLNAGGDSAEAAIAEAKRAFEDITQHAWLDLTTDFDRYTISAEPWKKFTRENQIAPTEPKLMYDAEQMSGCGNGCVVGVGVLESTFLAQHSPGPLGYALGEVAPLLVALNYFTQLEGPMWRLLRGSGLAYSYGVQAAHNEGRIVFSLYRATNPVAAYTKAKSIMEEFLADGKFDEDLFASAKSTAVFEIVEAESSPAAVVGQAVLNYVKRVPEQYNKELVCALGSVTPESAVAAARRWVPTLFDAAHSSIALVCHPVRVHDMQASFQKIGIKLDVFESMEASHFNK